MLNSKQFLSLSLMLVVGLVQAGDPKRYYQCPVRITGIQAGTTYAQIVRFIAEELGSSEHKIDLLVPDLDTFGLPKLEDRRWSLVCLSMAHRVDKPVGSALASHWSKNRVQFGLNQDPTVK
jgi:hypothetical protein